MSDAEETHRPVTADDVAEDNPRMIAGELRALKRDVNAGFELMTQKVLTRLDRFDQKLDVVIDRQNVLERRQDDLERRVAALESTKPRTTRRKR